MKTTEEMADLLFNDARDSIRDDDFISGLDEEHKETIVACLKQVRSQTIEECAKVCEEHEDIFMRDVNQYDCATAIRSIDNE